MSQQNQHKSSKLIFFLIPLIIFAVLVVFLLKGLYSNPQERESSTINRPIPQFKLYDLMDSNKPWTNQDLVGEVMLINVWGTWCITCDQELPYLTELRNQGVKIVGIYYDQEIDPDFGDTFNMKALQQDVSNKLSRLGNPYAFNIFDDTRELLLDLGVTGAPETFLVDKDGLIREHHLGDINPRVWQSKFAAAYKQLMLEAGKPVGDIK